MFRCWDIDGEEAVEYPFINNYIIRGGSWSDAARDCRSAARDGADKDARFVDCGFRLVRNQ